MASSRRFSLMFHNPFTSMSNRSTVTLGFFFNRVNQGRQARMQK